MNAGVGVVFESVCACVVTARAKLVRNASSRGSEGGCDAHAMRNMQTKWLVAGTAMSREMRAGIRNCNQKCDNTASRAG